MKKVLIIIFIFKLLFISFYSNAQSKSDSLIITPKRIYPVSQAGVVLKPAQLNKILYSNPEAKKEMEAAKGNQAFAMILGTAGGFMIGWPLGQAIGGGEPQWALAGIGAGLVAISIPLSSAAKKKTLKAIDLYNAGLIAKKETDPISFHLQGTKNGFGLVLMF